MKIVSVVILAFTLSLFAPAHFAYPYGGNGGGNGGAGGDPPEATRERGDPETPPAGFEPAKTEDKQEEKADSGEQSDSAQAPESDSDKEPAQETSSAKKTDATDQSKPDSDKEQAEETSSAKKADATGESKSDSDADKTKQTGPDKKKDKKKPDTQDVVFGPQLPPGVENASDLVSEMQEVAPKKPPPATPEPSSPPKAQKKKDDSLPDYESLKRVPPEERPPRQFTPKERKLVDQYMEIQDQLQKAVRERRREDVIFWGDKLVNMMIWHPELRDDFEAEPYHRARREEFMRRSSRRHLVQDLNVKQAKEDYYATKFFAKSAEVYAAGTTTVGQSVIVGVSSAVTESAYRGDKKGAGRVGKSLAKDAATALLPPGVNVVAGEAFDRTLGKKIENSLSNVRTRENARTQHLKNPLGETDSTFHGPRYSPTGKQMPYK